MTERRSIITRIWRPVGEPARRVEDFAEIPHLTVWPAQAAPAANQPDRREIGARLENWARYYTQSNREIEVTPIGRMYGISRLAEEIAAGTVESNGERRQYDEQDAWLIEQAMRHLTERHRDLLVWCYIRQAQPEVVCRKMSIAHRPATLFVDMFRQAQAAVESSLDKSKGKA